MYAIIPCSFTPGFESAFTLSVYSQDGNATLETMQRHAVLSASGAWSGPNAGGCINNFTWFMNPRYSLCVSQPCKVAAVLVQKNAAALGGNMAALHAIGLYVTRGDEHGKQIVATADDMIAKSAIEPSFDGVCFWHTVSSDTWQVLVLTVLYDTSLSLCVCLSVRV
jgi:hypothetical protein